MILVRIRKITAEKANPSKGGDAKPWIYVQRGSSVPPGYDSQAAEEEKMFVRFGVPGI